MSHPYSIQGPLSPDLAQAETYWKGLLRGNATMPFWDDLDPTALPGLADRLMLIRVFESPLRFRFDQLGGALATQFQGRFLDEVQLSGPLGFLLSQCSATVESAAPTLYRSPDPKNAFQRLLLPLWGEGQIRMLLGVIDFG